MYLTLRDLSLSLFSSYAFPSRSRIVGTDASEEAPDVPELSFPIPAAVSQQTAESPDRDSTIKNIYDALIVGGK